MKLDTSAAPEIAILAGELAAVAEAEAIPGAPSGPVTIGYLAACLRLLVADPQSWWGMVRFDPRGQVRIPVAAPGQGCEAWLLVLPPGGEGDGPVTEPGWQVACLVAGAMAERTGGGSHPLSHGRTRVRGGRGPVRMVNTGSGYAVSLHAQSVPDVTRSGV